MTTEEQLAIAMKALQDINLYEPSDKSRELGDLGIYMDIVVGCRQISFSAIKKLREAAGG